MYLCCNINRPNNCKHNSDSGKTRNDAGKENLKMNLKMKKIITFLFLLLSLGTYAEGQSDFGSARWIGATDDANSATAAQSLWFRRSFMCYKPVKKATLYVSGLGAYEVYLNYEKINSDILSPAWSDYDKTVFYNVIDMTGKLHWHAMTTDRAQLKKAANMIYVLVGNAFFHESGGRYQKPIRNFGPLMLLFRLEIEYQDGTRENICSDAQKWFQRKSPATYTSIYGGEDYDASLEAPDSTVTSEEYQWKTAKMVSSPMGELRRQIVEPMRIMETKPVVTTVSSNVFDMGQNMSGFPLITVTGKRGQTIRLIVGERLSASGHIDQTQTGAPHYYTYKLRGPEAKITFMDEFSANDKDGSETWHPRFSYYGFRFIEVEGAVMEGESNPNNLPVINSLKAAYVYTGKRTGSFECSNPLLTQTYKMIDNSVKSNWKSLFTNNPNRDKMALLHQIWLNGAGLMYNYDVRKTLENEMRLLADAQNADGSIADVAPLFLNRMPAQLKESPEFGGAIIAIPYMYKAFYNDSKLVNQYKAQMMKYFSYLESKAQGNIITSGLGDWQDYGPLQDGSSQNTDPALVSTAHYYYFATLLGLTDKAKAIKQAFIQKFKPDSEAGLAISLTLGLYPDGMKQGYLEKLVADIGKHLNRFTTGTVGTTYLFQALLDNDQGALLYKMLDHYDVPGYGNQTDNGMNSFGEKWDVKTSGVMNSFQLAHINNFLVQDVAGIHVSNGKITICPRLLGNMQWAKGSVKTTKGDVSVSWRIQNGIFSIEVVTADPANTTINTDVLNRICTLRNLKLQSSVRAR